MHIVLYSYTLTACDPKSPRFDSLLVSCCRRDVDVYILHIYPLALCSVGCAGWAVCVVVGVGVTLRGWLVSAWYSVR